MDKHEIDALLLAQDPDDLLPVWVISYNRARSWATADALRWMDPDVRRERVTVVVRESQLAEYRAAQPDITFMGVPDGYRGWGHSCGMARQAATDYAREAGHDRIIMLDDDLLSIRYLFRSEITRGARAGAEKSAYALVADYDRDPLLTQHVLGLFGSIAANAMAADPRVVIGSARRQAMSFGPINHRTEYMVNRGTTPRQMMVRDIAALEAAGIELDVPRFGLHGEDIGLTAQVLQAGLSYFCAPSITYDVVPEGPSSSVIRTPANEDELHALEYAGLQAYEIAEHYLQVRSRSLIDGSYEWGEVDWRALHRYRGTKPVVQPWISEQDLL